jgi:hypothetical protein
MKNIKPPSRSDANKIALFKGKYIAQFLNLEYGLERIIVRFFQEQYKIGVHGLTSAMNEMSEIAKRNENVAIFFGHHLFAEPEFGFNVKLNSVKFIMQLLDTDYYESLKKNGKENVNVFLLMNQMGQLRNIIAHNPADYTNSGVIGFKFVKEIEETQREIFNDATKKIEIIKSYSVAPRVNEYLMPTEIQKQIFEQLLNVQAFLVMYEFSDLGLNKNVGTKENHNSYREFWNKQFKNKEVFGKDIGVSMVVNKNVKRDKK